jgi:DNA-binding transcriptional ArsR family regulator/uncharacterized protein YndB with AHSA1/START domain
MQSHSSALDDVFSALADPTRRAILSRLAGGEATVSELMAPFALTQPTISKHLKVLERAGLIESDRQAQRRPRRLSAVALKDVADWVEPFRELWDRRLDNLERHLATKKSKENDLMPATTTKLPQGFEMDDDALVFRFVRQLDATPQEVFSAWTLPEEISLWWDPVGEQLGVCEIDLRVGGAFTFVTRAQPDMAFTGIYREIASPHSLVFDAMGAVGTVAIRATADGSFLTVEIKCPSREHFETFAKVGVHQGTSQTLDNLVAFLRAR